MTDPERIDSNQPEEAAAEEVEAVDVADFLTLCHNPNGMKPDLDAHLDDVQARTGATDRDMLRICTFLLSSIASSMPWNTLDGLDAQRIDHRINALIPSWRDCIGGVLSIDYSELEEDLDEAPDGPSDG